MKFIFYLLFLLVLLKEIPANKISIKNCYDFQAISTEKDGSSKFYVLESPTGEIDFSECSNPHFASLPNFYGTLDGNNQKIIKAVLSNGLFAKVTNATIKNLHVSQSSITLTKDTSNIGFFVGEAISSKFSNLTSSFNILDLGEFNGKNYGFVLGALHGGQASIMNSYMNSVKNQGINNINFGFNIGYIRDGIVSFLKSYKHQMFQHHTSNEISVLGGNIGFLDAISSASFLESYSNILFGGYTGGNIGNIAEGSLAKKLNSTKNFIFTNKKEILGGNVGMSQGKTDLLVSTQNEIFSHNKKNQKRGKKLRACPTSTPTATPNPDGPTTSSPSTPTPNPDGPTTSSPSTPTPNPDGPTVDPSTPTPFPDRRFEPFKKVEVRDCIEVTEAPTAWPEIGATGPQGPPGIQGATGPSGLTGSTGPIGLTGETGPIGQTGPRGFKGDIGEDGEKGEQGIKGQRGRRGYKGINGEKGERGERGRRGRRGERGEAGISRIIREVVDQNEIKRKTGTSFILSPALVYKVRNGKGNTSLNGTDGTVIQTNKDTQHMFLSFIDPIKSVEMKCNSGERVLEAKCQWNSFMYSISRTQCPSQDISEEGCEVIQVLDMDENTRRNCGYFCFDREIQAIENKEDSSFSCAFSSPEENMDKFIFIISSQFLCQSLSPLNNDLLTSMENKIEAFEEEKKEEKREVDQLKNENLKQRVENQKLEKMNLDLQQREEKQEEEIKQLLEMIKTK